MLKILAKIIILLLLVTQSGISQANQENSTCKDLLETLDIKTSEFRKVGITSTIERFSPTGLTISQIERIVDLSNTPRVDMTVKIISDAEEKIRFYKLMNGEARAVNAKGQDIEEVMFPQMRSLLKQSLDQQGLLPNSHSGSYVIKSCDGLKSYKERLKGWQATIETSLVPGKIEEVKVFF